MDLGYDYEAKEYSFIDDEASNWFDHDCRRDAFEWIDLCRNEIDILSDIGGKRQSSGIFLFKPVKYYNMDSSLKTMYIISLIRIWVE